MTSLFGGNRLSKDDLRIEAYGTLDELNALIGALGDHDLVSSQLAFLRMIQSDLFTWGSHLATTDSEMQKRLPCMPDSRIQELET